MKLMYFGIIMLMCIGIVNALVPTPDYYWSFDTDATCDIGGIDGTPAGDAEHISSTDMVGAGYYNFSGAGEVALQLDYDNSAHNNEELSISAWFYLDAFDSAQTTIQNAQEITALYGYKLNIANGVIQFSFNDNGGFPCVLSASGVPLNTSTLYHIVIVWDKDPNPLLFQDYLKLYINGEYITQQYCGNDELTFPNDDVCHIVGREAYGTGCTERDSGETQGGIDEYKIWYDRVLSESEIEEEYLSGLCTPNWSCNDFDACLPNDTRVCNSVEDLNTCDEAYGGDYSEFTPQVCDYCTPSWSCSSLGACNSSDVRPCLNVSDGNSCGESFTGDLFTYDAACTYVPPSSPSGSSTSASRRGEVMYCDPENNCYSSLDEATSKGNKAPLFAAVPGGQSENPLTKFFAWFKSIFGEGSEWP